MSNQAKDWQTGTYTVRVGSNYVEVDTIRLPKKSDARCPCIAQRRYIATAHCAPEDEFSLSMGVALAMDRLNKQLESKNKEIKVGDRVQIVLRGKSYPTLTSWVARHVHDSTMVAMYKYGCVPDIGIVGKVIAVAPHDNDKSKTLLYIEQNHLYGVIHPGCWLMDSEGVKKL